MSSGPVVPMVWEGLNVVKTGRVMLGETNPKDSKPGTIRGDYCIQVGFNFNSGSMVQLMLNSYEISFLIFILVVIYLVNFHIEK